jgi:tetratricopeptide (TPR) repeat protein
MAVADALIEGVDHHRRGRLAEAARAYRRILKLDPRSAHALHLLGLVRHQQGDQAEARELIQSAIAVDASNAAYHNSLGLVLLAEGDAHAAAAAFRAALERDPLMAEAFNNLGNAEQKAGRLPEAVESYDRALALAPYNAEALCNKGRALHGLDDLAAAVQAYRAALALRPDYTKAWRFLGDALAESGATAEAEASFVKALELARDDGETLAALAALQERAGRLEEALATAERALAAQGGPHGGHVRAAVAAARCERRLGRPEAGLARLRAVAARSLDAESRAHVAFELGATLDRLGAYEEAYAAYSDANACAAASPQARAVDREAMPRLIARLRERFTTDWVATWTPPLAPDGEDPVFLIGFPRSGTTLLDQILDAHPGLATMEEKPAIDTVRTAVAAMPDGYPEALATLQAADIERLRRLYFAEVARYVQLPAGVRLVDKMPLNTIDVGLIARLFPKAKLLLALRHPCDVVLSGFMQAFKPNPAMVQFETLAGSAAFYAAVMDLWRQYERVLPLSVHRIRYEDLIANFEAETRRMLAFLGLPWDEAVLGYAERAKTKAIATPSYHQVVQPIYARSIGRWRKYGQAFAEVLPLLRPSLATFGYDAEPPPLRDPGGEEAREAGG